MSSNPVNYSLPTIFIKFIWDTQSQEGKSYKFIRIKILISAIFLAYRQGEIHFIDKLNNVFELYHLKVSQHTKLV